MRFDILTIFPDLFTSPLQEGILRRAINRGQINVALHNIRNFAFDRHAMTDDRPFGGGAGMVMKPEPLAAALENIPERENAATILLSPRGTVFSHEVACRLAKEKHLVLVCGRYEGVDERIRSRYIDEEISIGDYILTGGELAAMVVIDAVARLLPGVLGCGDSAATDTFTDGLLKYPQYTRPRMFQELAIPEILLSGDHAEIAVYRFLESVRETVKLRPDLVAAKEFSAQERALLVKHDLWQAVQEIKDTANAGN